VSAPTPPRDNLVALAAMRVSLGVSAFVIQVFVARYLGREGYGAMSFLVGVTALCAAVFHMGSSVLIAREISRAPDAVRSWLARGLVTTLALSVLGTGCVTLYVALMDGQPTMIVAGFLAACAYALTSLGTVCQAAFQGLRRMRAPVVGSVAGRTVVVVATVALLSWGWGVTGVFSAQILGAVVALFIWLRVFQREIGRPEWAVTLSDVRELLLSSRVFAAGLVFGSIYMSSDLLIVKELHGDSEVGVYRAGAAVVLELMQLGSMLMMGLYPVLSRLRDQPERVRDELAFAFRVLLVVGAPTAVGGLLVAEPLMLFILGEEYRLSVTPFMVMLLVLPTGFIKNALGTALTACDRHPERMRGTAYAAVLNVGANLAFVPAYGAVGAAATTLMTEVLLAVYLGRKLRDHEVGRSLLRAGGPVLLPLACMIPVVAWASAVHIIVRVGLGVLVYGAVGVATGAMSRSDLQRLRSI